MTDSTLEARAPQQDRSRASYERMIAATLELLKERGGAGFTLAEVSKRGGVSIGSPLLRRSSASCARTSALSTAMPSLR